MNGDTVEVMKVIGENQSQLLSEIGKLHNEFSAHKANIDVRVQAIEDDLKSAKTKQWIHSCIVFAGSMIHHDLGRWLNLKF